MNNIFKTNKIIRIIILLLAIIIVSIISYSIYQINYRAGKIEVTINTVPKDAKVIINNQNYYDGENYIVAGEYNIVVKKDGFKTVELSQNIINNGDEINIALDAESDSAKAWATKNKQLYADFTNIVSEKANKDGVTFKAINPIVNKLPYINYLYSIGYKLDSVDKTGKSIIITVNSSEQYRQAAILQIKSWGYNLADYNYEFINFNNPFTI